MNNRKMHQQDGMSNGDGTGGVGVAGNGNLTMDGFTDNPPPSSKVAMEQQQAPSSGNSNGPPTSSLRLFGLAATFFLMMIVMELAMEAASRTFSHLDYLTQAITLFQFLCCFLLPAVVEGPRKVLTKFPQRPREFAPYIRLAFAVVGATGLATYSLKYVSFPTKVVFKSTKLIPTMLVATIVNPKTSKFGPLDYLSALLLCFGAAGYSYGSGAGDKGDNSTSYMGIAILCVSLCCDAVVPNMQQKLMEPPSPADGGYSALPTTTNGEIGLDANRSQSPNSCCARFAGGSANGGGLGLTAAELMVNLNAVVVIGLLTYMLLTGSLFQVIKTSIESPLLLGYLTLIGVGLSTAVLAYTQLIKSASSVVAVAVGTLRKVATVVLSYIVFPKPLLPIHIWSGMLVLAGVLLHSYSKKKRKGGSKK